MDTNVFYTATDRTTDVSASGGPGLELVLPLGGSGRFFANGNLDYLYFVKTESQRRLRWNADTGFDFKGARTQFQLVEYYAETFGRPNYEVDDRISQIEEGTRLDLKRRLFGRIAVRVVGRRARFETEGDPNYLGNDLAPTLTRDQYIAGGGLDYAITVKTSFVVEGDLEWDRFPLEPKRDADLTRLWAGFRTDETALISGQALVGSLWFRPQARPDVELRRTIADVNATWNISPKTQINFTYGRGIEFSSFETTGADADARQRPLRRADPQGPGGERRPVPVRPGHPVHDGRRDHGGHSRPGDGHRPCGMTRPARSESTWATAFGRASGSGWWRRTLTGIRISRTSASRGWSSAPPSSSSRERSSLTCPPP